MTTNNITTIDGFCDSNGFWIGIKKIDDKYYVGYYLGIYICGILGHNRLTYLTLMVDKFQAHCDDYNNMNEFWFETEEQARVAYDWLVAEFLAKQLVKG